MAPALPLPARTRASPLTNKKVLAKFKKARVDQLRMEEIMTLGTEYMKKQTSITFFLLDQWRLILLHSIIRRFSSSFGQLRIDHRRAKNAKKAEALANFENELFNWPEVEVENTGDNGGGEGEVPEVEHVEGHQVKLTGSGRATGNKLRDYKSPLYIYPPEYFSLLI